jgi:hypothetical protein
MKEILKQLERELLDAGLNLTSGLTFELVINILNNKNVRREVIIAIADEVILYTQILQHGSDVEKEKAILKHSIPCIEINDYYACLRIRGSRNSNYTRDHC